MIVEVLQLVVIVALGWLLYRSQHQAREALYETSEQHAAITAALFERLADLATQAGHCDPHPDLTQLIGLVDRLCQRVQAPDVAVTEHAMSMPVGPMPQPRPDQGYEGLDVFPEVSKEELAERYASVE